MSPDLEFATSADGVRIAWTSVGTGPVLIHLPGVPLSNVEAEWRIPVLRRAYLAMSEHVRLIQFDGRGIGRSQRVVADGSPGCGRRVARPMMGGMNTTTTDFVAGSPRRSGPIRRLTRIVGPLGSRMAGTRWFPLWAILRHTGRTTGRAYVTAVVARRTLDGFIIPLPFGDATQWARNLFAAGGGSIRVAGREHNIGEPRVVDREVGAAYLPPPLRFIAGRLGLREYVLVRRLSD